jgi:SNF2 family DNA or RNA helicase
MEKTSDLATEIYDGNEEESHRKIICFSFWKETTFGIHIRLNPNSISFVDKSPSGIFNTIPVEKRYERCDEFTNNPSITYLAAPLMSTQEGLNITAAGSCIFNDMWWNPKAHEQAEGRAYGRISDPHSLDSYYILCEDTIDTAIWDLVWGEKASIIAEVVDGVESTREYSVAKKLIEKIMEDAGKLKIQ